MDQQIEAKIEEYLSELDTYHLSAADQDVLRGYFRYLFQDKIRSIPYHFLVQADTDSRGLGFSLKLIEIVECITSRSLLVQRFTEPVLLDKPQQDKYDKCDAMLVGGCFSDQSYYPSDDDSSVDKSAKRNYDYRWDKIMAYFDYRPEKLFVLYGPRQILQGRIRNNHRMYYRFFKHHITLGNMTEEEVLKLLTKRISSKIGRCTPDFQESLREYVYTVYPKADLKNTEFVDDLYNWMVALTFQKTKDCSYFSSSSIPFYHRNASFESIDREFQQLVGLEEVKETFRNIGMLCQSMPGAAEKPYLHMVFRGNPGTGKTTVARLMAKLLSSMGVIRRNHVEEVMASDLLGAYTGQTAPKVQSILQRAAGGVLVIDEAYLLNTDSGQGYSHSYREECIGVLLKAMEQRTDPVIIFAGYPKEMDAFLKSNPGLGSRIGYDITFADYSTQQLLDIFKSMCQRSGYQCSEDTLAAVERKITSLRYEEHFGNARSVENVFNQSVIECLRSDPESRMILPEHIVVKKDLKTLEELQDQLKKMVGIENAKRTVLELIMSNRFSREMGKPLPVSNNMIFVGNAGTGKTTTAKLCAEMLFSIGAAKSPRTKMISAKDLYVQDVAEKLNDICKETMGGVLFIDEIYLLQSSPYKCAEVVSVLLELLESRKEDISFILAGYDQQMEDFLSENQGLRSRFPITVHFDDFTEDELCQIFVQNCESGGMSVNDAALDRFRTVIRREMKKDNFGNGRTVRNIYEQAFRRHAVNFYAGDKPLDAATITAEDIAELTDVGGSGTRIGFSAE